MDPDPHLTQKFARIKCIQIIGQKVKIDDAYHEYRVFYFAETGKSPSIALNTFSAFLKVAVPDLQIKSERYGMMCQDFCIKDAPYEYPKPDPLRPLRELEKSNAKLDKRFAKLSKGKYTLKQVHDWRRRGFIKYHYKANGEMDFEESEKDIRIAIAEEQKKSRKLFIVIPSNIPPVTATTVITPIVTAPTVTTPINQSLTKNKATLNPPNFYLEAYNKYRSNFIQLLENLKECPYQYPEQYSSSDLRFLEFMSMIPEELISTTISNDTYNRLNIWFINANRVGDDLLNTVLLCGYYNYLIADRANDLVTSFKCVQALYDMNDVIDHS